MTPDFARLAREVLVQMSFPPAPPQEAPTDRQLIEAALIDVWNAALEEAAAIADGERDYSDDDAAYAGGRNGAGEDIARTVRSKKITSP